jgi:uncharacterized protein (TIGR02118 family)
VLKVVIFFKRKAGMPVEAFQEHWRTTHADIIARLPGIRRYVQNRTLASGYRKGEPAFDGVAESSFDGTEAMKGLLGTREYQAVLDDEPNFIERSTMGSIITDEHVIKEGPAAPDAIKSISLVTRRDAMPIEEFFRYWREVHGPLCKAVPSFRRYVQCHTRRSIYASGRTPAYDGAAMTWFDSTEALRAAAGSEDFARLRADLEHFMASERSPSVLAREHIVLAQDARL